MMQNQAAVQRQVNQNNPPARQIGQQQPRQISRQQPQQANQKPAKKPVRKAYRYQGYRGDINRASNSQREYKKPPECENKGNSQKFSALFEKFVPDSIYNRNTKKLFGLLSAEDLLLVALIFIFADSDREDSSLMCLAILYLLISDYLDFSDFLSV